jgi:hypothetical protein
MAVPSSLCRPSSSPLHTYAAPSSSACSLLLWRPSSPVPRVELPAVAQLVGVCPTPYAPCAGKSLLASYLLASREALCSSSSLDRCVSCVAHLRSSSLGFVRARVYRRVVEPVILCSNPTSPARFKHDLVVKLRFSLSSSVTLARCSIKDFS